MIGTIGTHYNESKDNVGIRALIDRRFLRHLSLTRESGIEVPLVSPQELG